VLHYVLLREVCLLAGCLEFKPGSGSPRPNAFVALGVVILDEILREFGVVELRAIPRLLIIPGVHLADD